MACVNQMLKKKSYPSMEKLEKTILQNIHIFSEYGDFNHVICKQIYENIEDKNKVIELGKMIYQRGGIQALRMNYYVICYALKQNKNEDIQCQYKTLEHLFEKVTQEWIA